MTRKRFRPGTPSFDSTSVCRIQLFVIKLSKRIPWAISWFLILFCIRVVKRINDDVAGKLKSWFWAKPYALMTNINIEELSVVVISLTSSSQAAVWYYLLRGPHVVLRNLPVRCLSYCFRRRRSHKYHCKRRQFRRIKRAPCKKRKPGARLQALHDCSFQSLVSRKARESCKVSVTALMMIWPGIFWNQLVRGR